MVTPENGLVCLYDGFSVGDDDDDGELVFSY